MSVEASLHLPQPTLRSKAINAQKRLQISLSDRHSRQPVWDVTAAYEQQRTVQTQKLQKPHTYQLKTLDENLSQIAL